MRARFLRAVRSDFAASRVTPLTSVLLGASALMAAASCVASLAAADRSLVTTIPVLRTTMHASTVATIVFALVAGVVLATSEFRYGRIDQLLLSEPSRPLLVLAKVVVGAVIGTVYGVVGALVALASTTGFLRLVGESIDVGSEVVVRPLLGVVLAAALFGAVGVGIGIAVQNQPVALAGSLAMVLVVEPTALVGLPTLARWLPGASGLAATYSPDSNLLGQGAGVAALGLYLLAATAIAVRRLQATDV